MLFGTASMQFGSAPLNADLGGVPGGARHALPRILKLLKTCSPLLVVISLLETEISHERRIIIGHSVQQHLILVSFIEIDENVRLLSARKATRTERKDYEENVGS